MVNNFCLTDKEKLQIFAKNRPSPIYFESENPKKIMLEFFSEITLTYKDSAVLMAIGVCLGVLFYDLFIRYAQGFPYIILFGEPTSGKTTLLYCLAAIYGFTNHTELSRLNNIPLFIDELEKALFEKLADVGKDSFQTLRERNVQKTARKR